MFAISVEVPDHCGVITVREHRAAAFCARVVRQAPVLSGHTKIDPAAIFRLGAKAAGKIQLPAPTERSESDES